MLNHPVKLLFIFISSVLLIACSDTPHLNDKLALKTLSDKQITPGYIISMVTNNPNARGSDASGWDCSDKQTFIDASLVNCQEAGRSGVYLEFTAKGKQLLVGKPWGTSSLRNARVVAVTQSIQGIHAIKYIDESHATITYSIIYDGYTPFATNYLKSTIKLNDPQIKKANFVLKKDQWKLE